ncbi:E3 ubiquitin-protein ligase HECTD3 isoform X5 [Leopardus geoffroyi]|uniref:E3 ubiquitin-protein ligase HECTD3 isoform X4 n=1 Tax=Herpailurus yagouaroundi TaxID=1608482 RepID=UPI001AD77153|nr:E3 ubiquitin-protein ligase HECTD3 isoform X4 [Puma yagouaroundi]XP_045333076.1 E3 ubiquitin-protein ligase HECTD3 isoform X5 [Leopardus geoffroyi]
MAGPGPGAALESPRQLLGRVRFLAEAAQSLRAGRPLPKALAFVPREVLYKLYKDPAGPSRVLLPVWEAEGLGLRVGAAGPAPGTGSGPLRAARDSIELRRGACVRTTGEELCNGHGLWVKLTKEQLAEHLGDCGLNEGWLLVCRPAEGGARLVPIDTPDHLQRQQQLFGVDYRPVLRWEQVVDLTYSHRLGSRPQPAEAYTEAVQRLLKLLLTVDTTDDNFMPKRVVIYGGEGDNLKKLSDVSIDETLIGDVCVLEDMTVHLPVIEIRIVECRDDGIDVRLRGIKIKSSRQRELGLNADLFQPTSLVRYPRLEGTDPEVLYRRAVLLQRFIKILDSVLHHLVPAWDHTLGTFSEIKQVKQFLLLSRQRPGLVAQCLRDSESSKPSFMPRLYINRRLAMEHRACPLRDPACKNAVFTQVYEGLKPSDKYEKPLDYRWPMRYDQWWECKFIAEGIIDQGGGFRDSLADMSEELCPSSADTPVPLPFFVRTANQGNGTGEARDMYVPNPSCRDFAKYEWIGQLMGAALRGKEFLVLALPGFVWKQLSGEEVSWSKDFPAVDSVLVKLLEVMEGMDKETFEFKFGKELTFTTVLSDQQVVELIPGGAGIIVGYEDRSRFIQLVQKTRLEESKEQVAAMQAGLLKVVPQAVLDLLTWQELEKKVCGDPEVTVDALRKLTRFEDFEPSDTRVQYFWEALNNFTNEDRSRFLRFVTGRSRLPARIYIYPDKLGYETTDALPESSTCSSTLFLPHYASVSSALPPTQSQTTQCHHLLWLRTYMFSTLNHHHHTVFNASASPPA